MNALVQHFTDALGIALTQAYAGQANHPVLIAFRQMRAAMALQSREDGRHRAAIGHRL